jgi:hypothetical protein
MMSILPRRHRSQGSGQRKKFGGAAIMLALWALFLLSALVISWALDLKTRLAISGEGTRMLKAEAAACSGAEIALSLKRTYGGVLHGDIGPGATYDAHITGEGGRINIIWIVAGEDPQHLAILRQYLQNKGVDLGQIDTMIDSLLDWVEPNTGLHHLNAPPESDTYHPPHQPLTRVEELKQIAGWAEFTSQPGWSNDFAVTVAYGGPDLAWASRDVLLALPGMTPQIVDRFLQIRRGPDGVDGTADDTIFNGVNDPTFLAALGVTQQQFSQRWGSLTSPLYVQLFRVVSVGRAGNATRTVELVFQKSMTAGFIGAPANVLTWKEF